MVASVTLQNLKAKLLSQWSGLSQGRRVVLVAIALALLATAVGFLTWAQNPSYVVLYAKLDERDAAEVVERLKEAKVPYQISDGGTIRVPEGRVHEVRLQLASEGLPKGGGVGFELFDRTNLAMTDFAQRLNYQRALEGELARTISQLGPVASARVHLALPRDELYRNKQEEGSASVVVGLRPGRRLDEKQVQAIANLVAGSVEGLKPANLTIVDSTGSLLWDGQLGTASSGSISAAQMEAQRAYERSLETRVLTLLDGVLGPGKAAVRVSALLTWDQVERSSEIYAPEGTANQVRSLRETVERSSGATTLAGGIPGTASNIPGYVGVTGARQATATPAAGTSTTTQENRPVPEAERRELVQNFEISKSVEKVVRAPGTVERLSVALVLDDVIDPALAESIGKTVAAAVGLDTARGDVISVSQLPFDESLQAASAAQLASAQQMELFRTVALGASAVVAVFLLAIFLRRLARALALVEPKRATHRAQQVVPALASPKWAALGYQDLTALAHAQPQALATVLKDLLKEQ